MQRFVPMLMLLLWLAAVIGGFTGWELYETTAGPVIAAHDEAIEGHAELTVYLHPHCPCSRATLMEASELANRVPVRIVFVRPAGTPDGWEHGELWNAATAIPSATVTTDHTGAEARAAGAATSGCAVYHDERGVVQFRGGLTSARGRSGESRGRQAILAIVAGEQPNHREAPTFGCPLFDSTDESTN